MSWEVVEGDCVERMAAMPAASVDAVVCDPPYHLAFMGRSWDHAPTPVESQAMHRRWAREALRVLKPGGHLLAFGGTRTYHRLACAIEDAGFEIRDTIAWMYGSGFPKSLDVSKAIDKAAGAERTMRRNERWAERYPNGPGGNLSGNGRSEHYDQAKRITEPLLTSDPATPDAERWEGWGTALKPAYEPVVVARKPLAGTVAQTVLEHGTGALNVDATRIGTDEQLGRFNNAKPAEHNVPDSHPSAKNLGRMQQQAGMVDNSGGLGRWPANVTLDEQAAGMLGEPARFLYQAKASSAERNAGLDGFDPAFAPTMGNGIGGKEHDPDTATPKRNVHPTVKPIELMRWLVRLVTSPGGLVLDPFAGSGTTGCAAVLEGFDFVGIERDPEYLPIARARIQWWSEHPEGMELVKRLEAENTRKEVAASGQGSIFDLLDA